VKAKSLPPTRLLPEATLLSPSVGTLHPPFPFPVKRGELLGFTRKGSGKDIQREDRCIQNAPTFEPGGSADAPRSSDHAFVIRLLVAPTDHVLGLHRIGIAVAGENKDPGATVYAFQALLRQDIAT